MAENQRRRRFRGNPGEWQETACQQNPRTVEHYHEMLQPSLVQGVRALVAQPNGRSLPRNTTKPLDLPRKVARFCHGLQWSARPRHFGVSHEIIGPLSSFSGIYSPFSGPRGRWFKSSRSDSVGQEALRRECRRAFALWRKELRENKGGE